MSHKNDPIEMLDATTAKVTSCPPEQGGSPKWVGTSHAEFAHPGDPPMLKKILVSIATLALAALMVSSTDLFSSNTATSRSTGPTIALVNEDQPASFNGAAYQFGTDFVRLVSNDSRHNWQ